MVGLVAAIHGFMCKMGDVVDARHRFTLGPAGGRARVAGCNELER